MLSFAITMPRAGCRIWNRLLPLVHLYTHQLIGPVSDLATYRSILNIWGLEGGYSRNPFYPLDPEQEVRLEDSPRKNELARS